MGDEICFRRACAEDIPAVAGIYEAIHAEEEAGRYTIGWKRGIYPTRATAELALGLGDLFVLEKDGRVLASARINREQVDVYAQAAWRYPAPAEQVMVLHTLTVEPSAAGCGLGSRFVAFYEDYARSHGCPCLRMDTNAINTAARRLYRKLGYREADIVPCRFNGIENVQLVCLEKNLTREE